MALPRGLELGPRVLHHPSHALREWHGRTPVPGPLRHRGVEADPRDVAPPVRGVSRLFPVSRGRRHCAKQLAVRHLAPHPTLATTPEGPAAARMAASTTSPTYT